MNRSIRRKLIEVENQPATIEHQFKRAITLDRNYRKSKREEERLRGKKETNGVSAPRLNNQEASGQVLPQPQIWPRKQETPQQWVPMGPALMEGVKKINTAIVTVVATTYHKDK